MDLQKYDTGKSWEITRIMNFGFEGYNTFREVVLIVGLIAFIIIGAQMMMSGENTGRIRAGIFGLGGIILGVAVIWFAPIILQLILTALDGNTKGS